MKKLDELSRQFQLGLVAVKRERGEVDRAVGGTGGRTITERLSAKKRFPTSGRSDVRGPNG